MNERCPSSLLTLDRKGHQPVMLSIIVYIREFQYIYIYIYKRKQTKAQNNYAQLGGGKGFGNHRRKKKSTQLSVL